MSSNDPLLVQAVYSFKGKNNDELCLKKGDIVTVTQKEEGGWWEGTLKEKTGWFPSNYVREYMPQGEYTSDSNVPNLPIDLVEQLRSNRAVVVMDIVESERAHVTELKTLIQSFLIPLKNSNIMTVDEYNQLVNNIEEVSRIHEGLLESLEQAAAQSQCEQRIGKLFLNKASSIRSVHLHYCSSHPRAVNIIEKYKDELNQVMETQGAVSPGILVLTVSLSKPFRRLDKYSGMLQELERHLEENHVDRGDTQRSVSVYKEIASVCLATRRQKELELSILSGVVQGWEGADAGSLGDVIKIGSVAFSPEHKDRYLVLFSTHLLILSVSQRLSSFIYEGKLPLTGICVKKLENCGSVKNAFEISGPMIEHIIAVCQTKEEQLDWVLKINKQLGSSKSAISKTSNTSVSLSLGRLSDYFAHMVCKGVITSSLLKAILYKRANSVDTSQVVRRRANRANHSICQYNKINKFLSEGNQYDRDSNVSNNIKDLRHFSSMVLKEDGQIVYGKKLLFTPLQAKEVCEDLTKLTLYSQDVNKTNGRNEQNHCCEPYNQYCLKKHLTIPLLNINDKKESNFSFDNRDSTYSLCDLQTSNYSDNCCQDDKSTEISHEFQYFKLNHNHNSLRSSDSGLADITMPVNQQSPFPPTETSSNGYLCKCSSSLNINSSIFEDDSGSTDKLPSPSAQGVTFRSELYAHWWLKKKLQVSSGSCDSDNRSVWDVTRLRPIPPLQFYHHHNEKNVSAAKKYERTFEDDGKVLRVFEAFCSNTKSRHASSGN